MFVKIADIITPCKVGNVEIDIMDYTQRELGFRETISGLRKEKYARLRIDGETMMSETPMEHRTNMEFVSKAYGDVLIGGLGIGMIVMAIQDNPQVKSITIVENNENVIEACSSLTFNSKVTIINDDVFTYKPERKFDCIYMDIWFYPNEDAYEEMKTLKRKYGHYLKSAEVSPKRFNMCWAEYYARTGTRLI